MNRIVKAVLWAVPPIFLWVIIPRIILETIPVQWLTLMSQHTNIDPATFVLGLNVIGIALAILKGFQTWAYKWSIVKPVSSALYLTTGFTLMLYLIGLGNISTLGVTQLTVRGTGLPGNTNLALSLNLTLQFLALMAGIVLILKIVQNSMKYAEDRRNHRLELGLENPVPPTGPLRNPAPTIPSHAIENS